jgi:hypothetical protein
MVLLSTGGWHFVRIPSLWRNEGRILPEAADSLIYLGGREPFSGDYCDLQNPILDDIVDLILGINDELMGKKRVLEPGWVEDNMHPRFQINCLYLF